MKKKYKYRHLMLEYLYTKIEDEPIHKVDLSKSKSSFSEMANSLKIDVKQLKKYHQSFHAFSDNDHHVQCSEERGDYKIMITGAGNIAYLDSYWLKEGAKDTNERIYDKTKWIVPIAALILTIASFSISISSVKQTQHKVDMINKEVLLLKYKLQQAVDSLKNSQHPKTDSLSK